MRRFFCWEDAFIYKHCCDTDKYGVKGIELCFTSTGREFDDCCPPPGLHSAPGDQVAMSWFDGGCDANFPYATENLARAVLTGPSYHPHTGAVLSVGYSDEERTRRVEQELEVIRTKTFFDFVEGVLRFWADRTLDLTFMVLWNVILGSFADAWVACPSAALLAGFLHSERMFDIDWRMAQRNRLALETLHVHAMEEGRVRPGEFFGVSEALGRLDGLRDKWRPPWPVRTDLVIPICELEDMTALSSSFREGFSGVAELFDRSNDAYVKRRRVSFRLRLYDVCGRLALLGLGGRNVSRRLLGDALRPLRRLFRDPQVVSLTEEVPNGETTPYLAHFATAASSGDLAEVTLLLHADFLEHVRHDTFERLVSSLMTGSWPLGEFDFMYLGWRHEGPVGAGGRVFGEAKYRCPLSAQSRRLAWPCFGGGSHPLARNERATEYNPVLLDTLWRVLYGLPFDPVADEFGGYDFGQLLVTRQAVLRRSPSYWRYVAGAVAAKHTFRLLPGTKFISKRVDLDPRSSFNKGLSVWMEHQWHLLLDPRFFPERPGAGSDAGGPRNLCAYTRLADRGLPLGLRLPPDSVVLRHYLLDAPQQLRLLADSMSRHQARLADAARNGTPGGFVLA